MTLDQLTAWFNDPLVQRIWQIGQDVRAGRADEATVRAWEDLQETVERVLKAAERATARAEPQEREQALRTLLEVAHARPSASPLH